MEKKFHTLITLLICDKHARILYMGNLYPGSDVDMNVFKRELATFDYSQLKVWVDLGFIGINRLITCQEINIGYKASKNHPLTDAQKVINYELARIRVKIEHAIAGLKRYAILRYENRLKKPTQNPLMDMATEACAALWNFKRKNPTSIPSFA